jgi:hypothetical protein
MVNVSTFTELTRIRASRDGYNRGNKTSLATTNNWNNSIINIYYCRGGRDGKQLFNVLALPSHLLLTLYFRLREGPLFVPVLPLCS